MSDATRQGSLPAPLGEPGADRDLAALRGLSDAEARCALLISYATDGDMELAGRRARELAPRDAVEARLLGLLDVLAPAAAKAVALRSPLGPRLANAAINCAAAIDRHRSKGQQTVRVEHVTVNAGGQAIVGAVSHPGRRDGSRNEHQPHASGDRGAEPDAPVRGEDAERGPVPAGGGEGQGPLPDARRGEGQRGAGGRAERAVAARPAQRRGAGGAGAEPTAAAAGGGRAQGSVGDG